MPPSSPHLASEAIKTLNSAADATPAKLDDGTAKSQREKLDSPGMKILGQASGSKPTQSDKAEAKPAWSNPSGGNEGGDGKGDQDRGESSSKGASSSKPSAVESYGNLFKASLPPEHRAGRQDPAKGSPRATDASAVTRDRSSNKSPVAPAQSPDQSDRNHSVQANSSPTGHRTAGDATRDDLGRRSHLNGSRSHAGDRESRSNGEYDDYAHRSSHPNGGRYQSRPWTDENRSNDRDYDNSRYPYAQSRGPSRGYPSYGRSGYRGNSFGANYRGGYSHRLPGADDDRFHRLDRERYSENGNSRGTWSAGDTYIPSGGDQQDDRVQQLSRIRDRDRPPRVSRWGPDERPHANARRSRSPDGGRRKERSSSKAEEGEIADDPPPEAVAGELGEVPDISLSAAVKREMSETMLDPVLKSPEDSLAEPVAKQEPEPVAKEEPDPVPKGESEPVVKEEPEGSLPDPVPPSPFRRSSDAGSQAVSQNSEYRPLKIKRPTKTSDAGAPRSLHLAATGTTGTPEPPGSDVPPPPPPPTGTPPPAAPLMPWPEPPKSPDASPAQPHVRANTTGGTGPSEPEAPVNKALRATQSMGRYDDLSGYSASQSGLTASQPSSSDKKPLEAPNAPNPNLRDPPTRPGTPAKLDELEKLPTTPRRKWRRPTADEESITMHRVFRGTTTLSAYDLGSKLGEGTFGVVTKGKETATGRLVALKKLIMHNMRDGVSMTTIREIKILKTLLHTNVVPILDMVVQPRPPSDRTGRQDVFMVFPFMDHDLCGLLANVDFKLTLSVTKLFLQQILFGMAYIHAQGFIHRDIKTANILVNMQGRCMIADFGLARAWSDSSELPQHSENEYTNMVVTRWYRAPELLLGARKYGPEIDMWSIGCVFGEMYRKDPWLAGESDRDQLIKIFTHCGPLNENTMPGWRDLDGFPDEPDHPWNQTVAGPTLLEMSTTYGLDRVGADLLSKLLVLNPKKRISADSALNHPWFFIEPRPASTESTDLKVSSSHEMTTSRRQHEPIQRPAPAAATGSRPPRISGGPAGIQHHPIQQFPPPGMPHPVGSGWPTNTAAANGLARPPYGQFAAAQALPPGSFPPSSNANMPMGHRLPGHVPPAPFRLAGAAAGGAVKRGFPGGGPTGPNGPRGMDKRPKVYPPSNTGLPY